MRKSSTDKRQQQVLNDDSSVMGMSIDRTISMGGQSDADVEGDMVVGDLEGEDMDMPIMPVKPRLDQGIVREDAEQIVEGWLYSLLLWLLVAGSICVW